MARYPTLVVKTPPAGMTLEIECKVKLSGMVRVRYWLALRLIRLGAWLANIEVLS